MIKDSEMYKLGFLKRESYKKKKLGVSKYSWYLGNFALSIEKDLSSDNDDFFQPTLKYSNCIWRFTDIGVLKKVLISLNLI
tara:strand:- start:5 stop:247 length:243 start_codon:yes stop_codon:yes gene_type:complete